MKNKALGDVFHDKFSTKQSRVLSLDTPPCALFFVHACSGALIYIRIMTGQKELNSYHMLVSCSIVFQSTT